MLINILFISATIVEDTHVILRKKKGTPEQKHTWNDFTNKIRRSFVFDDKKLEHSSNRNSLITPELALPYDFQADLNLKDKKETRHRKSGFKLEETEVVNKNKETDCNTSADTSFVNQSDIQRSISRNDSIGSEVSEKSLDNTGSTQLKLSNLSQNSKSGAKEEIYFDLLNFDSDLGPFQDDPKFKRLAQELKETYEEIFSYSYDKNGDKDDKNFVRKLVLKVVIR